MSESFHLGHLYSFSLSLILAQQISGDCHEGGRISTVAHAQVPPGLDVRNRVAALDVVDLQPHRPLASAVASHHEHHRRRTARILVHVHLHG